MNAAFSEIQDGAFSHLPLLQFLYGQGLVGGGGGLGRGRGREQTGSGLGRAHVGSLWKLRCRRPYFCPDGHAARGGAAWGQEGGGAVVGEEGRDCMQKPRCGYLGPS